jgi:hypothetical protein
MASRSSRMDSCVSGNHNLLVGKMGPAPKCELLETREPVSF